MSFFDTLTQKLGFDNQDDEVKRVQQKSGNSVVDSIYSKMNKSSQLNEQAYTRRPNLGTGADIGKNLSDQSAKLGQEFLTRPIRFVAQSFQDIGGFLGDKDYKPEPFVPTTPVEQATYGKEPIYSFVGRSREEKQKSKEIKESVKGIDGEVLFKGINPIVASTLGFLGSVAPLADILPGGATESKALKKILQGYSDDAVKFFMKNTDNVKSYERLTALGVEKELAKESSQLLNVAKTKKEVDTILRDTAAKQLQSVEVKALSRVEELTNKQKGISIAEDGSKIKVAPKLLIADELDELKFLKENIKKPENIILANRAAELGDDAGAVIKRGADDLGNDNRLFNEIKKYDTPEKFLNKVNPLEFKDELKQVTEEAFTDLKRAIKNEFGVSLSSKEVSQILKDSTPILKKYPQLEKPLKDGEIKKISRDIFNSRLKKLYNEVKKGNISQVNETKALDKARGAVEPITINRTTSGTVSNIKDAKGSSLYNSKGKGSNLTPGSAKPANPKSLTAYNRGRKAISDKWDNIVESVQNNANRIEKIVDNPNAVVDEKSNPALSRILYSGRLQSRIEDTVKEVKSIIDEAVGKAKTANIKYDEFKGEVNEYLHSLHAPERNAQLGSGAAGMTDNEAKSIMERLKKSPHYKDIKETSDKLLKLNKETLDILYADGRSEGLITKEVYDNLRSIYKNHVPLNRIFEETENISSVLNSRGFDVRGSGLRKAKGSGRAVDDIVSNITSNAMSATQRAEKNIVDNATYDFIKNNPDMNFARILKPSESATVSSLDSTILQLRREGKDAFIKFEDPVIASQFKGNGLSNMPKELNFIGAFTRFYSSLMTRFSPEFFISNKFRDIQEALIYSASESKLGAKGTIGILSKEIRLQNEKAIIEFMAGKDTKGARLYKEMVSEGGTTGGLALSTRKGVASDIESIEKLAQSKPRRALQGVIGTVDKLNEVFENSTRLSVYRQAREMGVSKMESARLAKESTVNFNRTGNAKWINSMYMFANASIQGSAKMIKAMKNPKVLAGVAGTVGTSVFTINKMNDNVDPDWKEKVNKWDRNSNMVIVLRGGDKDKFKYVTIPVSYAIKPFKVAFDGAYDLMQGREDVDIKDVLSETTASIIDGYNPLGGTSLGASLTPTIADVPREIGLNQKWTGSKIRPDYDPDLPASRQYWDSINDSTLGRFSTKMTRMLSDNHIAEISPANMQYAIEQYGGGVGKFSSKTMTGISQIVGDEDIKVDELPFVSRFYKQIEGDQLESAQTKGSKDYELIKDIKQQGAAKSFDRKQELEQKIKAINKLETVPEKVQMLKDIAIENEQDAEDIISMIKDDKKDFNQKQYESLQIKNGERAKFIVDKMDSFKTDEEKKEFLKDLAVRKILTEDVLQQIEESQS